MKLRTEIEPTLSDFKIQGRDYIMTIGSCFSDNIGQLLAEDKLSCLINPFGTIYNPVSICTTIQNAIDFVQPQADLFTEKETIWHHFAYHSTFWKQSKDQLVQQINEVNIRTNEYLSKTKYLVITWGTAYVYRHKKTNTWVTNCHKVPASEFEKVLLTTNEITDAFSSLHDSLRTLNPFINIILTISPVRHTKDTLSLNSLSKSILRVAASQVQERYPNVSYFPAFEIMQDDLRDYRFYEKDLIHPTQQAIEYIYEHFTSTYFSDQAKEVQVEWEKIKSSLNHKPFYEHTASHLRFLEKLAQKLIQIKSKLPVETELKKVSEQIASIRKGLE